MCLCLWRSQSSASNILWRRLYLFGIALSGGDKDVDPAAANLFLGVISDLSRVVEGIAVMRSKPSRVAAIMVAAMEMVERGSTPHAELDGLVGKLEYTSSTGASARFGRAALAVLRAWCDAHRGAGPHVLTDEAMLALRFFIFILPLVRPRVFRLAGRRRRPIIVYTDARYSPGAAEPAELGIAIYDPEDDETGGPQWRHSSLVVTPAVMALLAKREFPPPCASASISLPSPCITSPLLSTGGSRDAVLRYQSARGL